MKENHCRVWRIGSVASNRTADGRAQNRRVELRVEWPHLSTHTAPAALPGPPFRCRRGTPPLKEAAVIRRIPSAQPTQLRVAGVDEFLLRVADAPMAPSRRGAMAGPIEDVT